MQHSSEDCDSCNEEAPFKTGAEFTAPTLRFAGCTLVFLRPHFQTDQLAMRVRGHGPRHGMAYPTARHVAVRSGCDDLYRSRQVVVGSDGLPVMIVSSATLSMAMQSAKAQHEDTPCHHSPLKEKCMLS